MKKAFKYFYLSLVYLFLYIPIVVLIVFSFNNTRYSTNWQGFTLDWYHQLFLNEALMGALGNSLMIALSSSVCATFLGTLAALAFYRYRFWGRKVMYSFIYVVMMSPDIVMGISLLMCFISLGLEPGAPDRFDQAEVGAGRVLMLRVVRLPDLEAAPPADGGHAGLEQPMPLNFTTFSGRRFNS